MSRRVLRSAALLSDSSAATAVNSVKTDLTHSPNVLSTPKKRKISTKPLASVSPKKSPKKPKYSFKQWESDLAIKYPIPDDLSLPENFVSQHQARFISGIKEILQVDPSLYPLIVSAPFHAFNVDNEPDSDLQHHYEKLCRFVISQQVSGASARSIEAKYKALFGGEMPKPGVVLKTENEELRSAGISARKSEYIKSISQTFADGEVTQEFFSSASDNEIIDKLVEMKGIGPWTAKMFLIFGLQRFDVFAHDDLGVARGMSRYLETRPYLLQQASKEVDMSLHKQKGTFQDNKRRDWKVIHDAHVQHVAEHFKPNRSLLMLILWRISSTDIEVLEHS